MRLYFTSQSNAALKLNGAYVGKLDMFGRYAELDLADGVLAEISAEGCLPLTFFIDEKLLSSPPDFLDVCLADDEAFVHARRFTRADMRLEALLQVRFGANLVTVFSQGGIYLSVEGDGYFFTEIGQRFSEVRAEENTLSGYPVLALYGKDSLIVISLSGERIFENEAESAIFGDTFKVRIPLATCTRAAAELEYVYDGKKLNLINSKIEESEADEKVMRFAFFESVLIRGDYKKYLSPELLPHSGKLKEYLGDYICVTTPTSGFSEAHPNSLAVGLVYRIKKNLYRVKYFSVTLKDGKIDNVRPEN